MTTFYVRAQQDAFASAVLRVVEGQVRAAMADHKEWNLPERAARSIAKRCAGDVVANWSRLNALRTGSLRAQSDGG